MKVLSTLLQINHYPDNYKRFAEWALKILVSGLCFGFILQKISPDQLLGAMDVSDVNIVPMLAVLLVLMTANWSLEAWRWRLSLRQEGLSFTDSLRIVLAGLALNWVIPFTLGDASARLNGVSLYRRGFRALIFNRAILLLITGSFGAMSVLYYLERLNLSTISLIITAAVISLVLLFFTYSGSARLLTICALSLLRYAIFTFQFYLLLAFFLPSLAPLTIIMGIGWIFLFRSFIPALFGNFGVREASALVFFQSYLQDPGMVVVPCLLIWLINTVIPSFAGVAGLLNLKVNIAQ